MKRETKEKYISPTLEVIELEHEGVMATSTINSGQFDNGGSAWGSSTTRSKKASIQNQSSIDDLGDIINDFLTVNK